MGSSSLTSLNKGIVIGKYIYKREYKKKPGDPGTWSQKKKMEAVITWLTTGNLVQTAAIIVVGHDTVKKWRATPWWKEATDQFYADDKQELDAKYQKIIRKALVVTEDRLENGNFQMDQKTGRIVRVPISISDSHRVSMDLVNQQQALRTDKKLEQIVQESVNDKLLKLANQFAQMASGRRTEKLVEDVPEEIELQPVEGVYEAELIPNPTPMHLNAS